MIPGCKAAAAVPKQQQLLAWGKGQPSPSCTALAPFNARPTPLEEGGGGVPWVQCSSRCLYWQHWPGGRASRPPP